MAETSAKGKNKKDKRSRSKSKERQSSRDRESDSPRRETCEKPLLQQSPKASPLSPRHRKGKKHDSSALDMGIKNMEITGDDVVIQTVEILKRPGQSLGFYIREGNGIDRTGGVFISRIAPGSIVEKNGLLRMGDEIVTVNTVNVTSMNLDDVVVLMSIPKKLTLTIRTRSYSRQGNTGTTIATIEPQKPVVVLKQGSVSFESRSEHEQDDSCPDEFILAGREAREAYSRQMAQGLGLPEGLRHSRSKALQHQIAAMEQVEKEDSNDSGLSSETSASYKGAEGGPKVNGMDDVDPKFCDTTDAKLKEDYERIRKQLQSKSDHSTLSRKASGKEPVLSSPQASAAAYYRTQKQQSLEYMSPRKSNKESPDYNSDSEIWGYHHDYHGLGDDTRSNSLPKINVENAEEMQDLVHKFNTLSHDLQEYDDQQAGMAAGPPYPTATSAKHKERHDSYSSSEYMSWTATLSPMLYRKFTQQPHIILRKPPADVLLSPHQIPNLDNSFDLKQEQKYSTIYHTVSQHGGPKMAEQNFSPDSVVSDTMDRARAMHLSSRLHDLQLSRKPLRIRIEDFLMYRPEVERKQMRLSPRTCVGLDGLLSIHIYCGHGLKSSKAALRDLYCVLEIDRMNKARTMIRTGAINFDWDEMFEIDLEDAWELSCLVYNWDPMSRHKLCFTGTINLVNFLHKIRAPTCKLALKMEPKGLIYLELSYKEAAVTLQRTPSIHRNALFGATLESVIRREKSGLRVPIIVHKCIEEIDRRGLETVGTYRVCGSARRKGELREEFEKNPFLVDLSPDNVMDIHVVTGLLKDYLRELPEPLFTNALYNMLVDALCVQMPGDPEGNAKLMLSILECLPKPNQDTMVMLLDHLNRVAKRSDINKMTTHNLAVCFGPVLLCPSPGSILNVSAAMDFKKHIQVVQYLLDIWPQERGLPMGLSESDHSTSSSAEQKKSPSTPSRSVQGDEK
ncbi:rho GTPase-activating protein 100F [Lingula anatina]|uniref:Rho GTPase-activating protein 100F n=1 Tax=Lingula anatina TaxID=7574 RepID=A0A1S3IIY2_LINAN|nr:rho GTPase-activating protein 100F [Lingula anatina]|eukprot:XP_013397846.1 rho GTPase-activating protein 100F [Lingula anatina]